MNVAKTKKLASVVVAAFLLIHILMFVIFYHYGVTPMAYFNIGSIIFYICMFGAVRKEMFQTYVIGIYLEVNLHMFFVIIFTGWNSGFQITLIGMSVLLFYSEYLSKYLKKPYVPSFPLCLLGPVIYILSCIWLHYNSPRYALPSNISFWFEIFWAIVVFTISNSALYIFVNLGIKAEKNLEKKADHDQLTGLLNRYYLSDFLSNINPSENEYYWAAIMDIDDFKKINDTYGHNCGDYILIEISNLLFSWRRECGAYSEIDFSNDIKKDQAGEELRLSISRWGGEEILVIGSGGKDIIGMLDLLRKKIEEKDFVYNNDQGESEHINVTVTIGFAEYKTGMTALQWIDIADSNLYSGKENGKNKVVF
ncbi:MAG: GGDEF domain-containing protein [Lachnospiraceae bacterium]|nr:GGDEF domain-containing protein [Lachnospiraceae bacterium]